MKRIFWCVAAAALLAGCATTTAEKKDQYDIRPDAAKAGEAPSSVDWQGANRAALDAATKPEALAPYVADAAAADALLAQVKGAYATDPMTAMRIGAISQLVMCPKCPKAPAARAVWTEALLKAAEGSGDAYRTIFFLDQLRWCGTKQQAARVLAIGAKSRDGAVKDFAAWTVRELEGRTIGK